MGSFHSIRYGTYQPLDKTLAGRHSCMQGGRRLVMLERLCASAGRRKRATVTPKVNERPVVNFILILRGKLKFEGRDEIGIRKEILRVGEYCRTCYVARRVARG